MTYKTAKELFWDFSCNHFYINKDGMREKYVDLGGNSLDEKKWRKEYISFYLKQIPSDEILSYRKLSNANATEALSDLINHNTFKDDYTKFWYAFELLEISKSSYNVFLKIKAKKKIKNILTELLKKSIILNLESKNAIDLNMLMALKAKTPEEYVRNYANILLLKL